MMKAQVLLLVSALLALAGCATKGEKDDMLPQAQPAPWEGTIPGMPGSPR